MSVNLICVFIFTTDPEDVGLESPNATQKTLEVNVTVNDKRRQVYICIYFNPKGKSKINKKKWMLLVELHPNFQCHCIFECEKYSLENQKYNPINTVMTCVMV